MPRDKTTCDVEATKITHDMTKLLASNLYLCVLCNRTKYFRGRKVFGDWDLKVYQVSNYNLTIILL